MTSLARRRYSQAFFLLACILAADVAAVGCRPTRAVSRASPRQPSKKAERSSRCEYLWRDSNALNAAAVDLVVKEYALELRIDPDADTYSGTLALQAVIPQATDAIRLHSVGLSVTEAHLRTATDVDTLRATDEVDQQTVRLEAENKIPPGDATLRLAFTGEYHVDTGIFRRSVRGASSIDNYVFTFFEPTYARTAFPSVDTPASKVPVSLSLIVPRKSRAFANTSVDHEEMISDDWKRVVFRKSPPLPAYLVAFAVGPFEVVEAADESIPIRAVVPRGEGAHVAPRLRRASALLRRLCEYFGEPPPYTKVDLLAVPSALVVGMENPGLIALSASLLSGDRNRIPNFDGAFDKTLLHEFAHLWFGDLVTVTDWDEVWLQEALAIWAEDRFLAPGPGAEHSVGERLSVKRELMQRDREWLISPVATRDDASTAGEFEFDPRHLDRVWSRFRKAAAVLRMVELWIGEPVFRKSLRAFVRSHRHRTATARDLVRELSRNTEKPVCDVLHSYLTQRGMPEVRVTVSCEGDQSRARVTQRPYLGGSDQVIARRASQPSSWVIPVCFRYNGRRQCLVLKQRPEVLSFKTKACPTWLYPDADAVGYYSYAVEEDTLAALLREDAAGLGPEEVVGLAFNVRASIESGLTKREVGLRHMRAMMALPVMRDSYQARAVLWECTYHAEKELH